MSPCLISIYGIPAYFVISRVEAASNLHRFDGVKYGYRTKEAVQGLAGDVSHDPGRRIWSAAEIAHFDGDVCECGPIQRAILSTGIAGAQR